MKAILISRVSRSLWYLDSLLNKMSFDSRRGSYEFNCLQMMNVGDDDTDDDGDSDINNDGKDDDNNGRMPISDF